VDLLLIVSLVRICVKLWNAWVSFVSPHGELRDRFAIVFRRPVPFLFLAVLPCHDVGIESQMVPVVVDQPKCVCAHSSFFPFLLSFLLVNSTEFPNEQKT
jgi:hypothetical protein